MTPALAKRQKATQATLDRFLSKPLKLSWNDCVRMSAMHLRRLGHQVALPKAGSYKTPLAARRALKAAGYERVSDALDALGLERIPPASAIIGDVIEMPSSDDLGALAIVLGNGKVLAFHPDVPGNGAAVLKPLEFVAAWRAI